MKRLLLAAALLLPSVASDAVTLPVEVIGPTGTLREVKLTIPPGKAASVTGLWLHTHRLTYDNKASVQVGNGPWVALANSTEGLTVADPGKKFGGIGGGFRLLKLTLNLAPGQVVDGGNMVRFRFNFTDGVSIGYRVVGIDFVTATGEKVCDPAQFRWEDPANWKIPFPAASDIAEGRRLWTSEPLYNSPLNKTRIKATCGGCHARDGRDLKYFNYSSNSIMERSLFHGLTARQGWQIASYVRSLPGPAPGRPYNPPYQPGPGIDAKPVSEWTAGAGFQWILDRDADTLKHLYPFGPDRATMFTRKVNVREIPIALPLPDWNDWLPEVHPLDAWGDSWASSEIPKRYDGSGTNTTYTGKSLRTRYADTANLSTWLASGTGRAEVAAWVGRFQDFMVPRVAGATDTTWTPAFSEKVYSTGLWMLVKDWEMMQEFDIQSRGSAFFGPQAESRTWLDGLTFLISPFMRQIRTKAPGTGINGSALTTEYLSNAWYHTQLVLNPGNGKQRGSGPTDWGYVWGKFNDLYRLSGHKEPGRWAVNYAKGIQEWDKPILGGLEGWQPQQMPVSHFVHPTLGKIFLDLPAAERTALFTAFLGAFLDKSRQFTPAQWYAAGFQTAAYVPVTTNGYDANFGDRLWFLIAPFRAQGVSATLLNEVADFGKQLYPNALWETQKVGTGS
jgi:hypothetical protein